MYEIKAVLLATQCFVKRSTNVISASTLLFLKCFKYVAKNIQIDKQVICKNLHYKIPRNTLMSYFPEIFEVRACDVRNKI